MALLSTNKSLESDSKNIVKLVNKAIDKAKLFFDYYANKASNANELNIINNSLAFYDRYYFQLKLYKIKLKELANYSNQKTIESELNDPISDFVNRHNHINLLQREKNGLQFQS
jgi:hypothetical protein